MRLQLVTLGVILLNSASVLSIPRQSEVRQLDSGLARRNDTAAMSGELSLNISPNIVSPLCGSVNDAQISVQYAPDPFDLSTPCQNVLSYIGGSNNKGKKNVNVVFACLGESVSSFMGAGDQDIKMIFNLVASASVDGANSGTQLVPSNLELADQQDNTFITTQVNLGVKMSDSAATFQYIYC